MALLEANVVWSIVGLCAAYAIFRYLKNKRLSYSDGCAPPRQYPHKDPFLGLDLFLRIGKMLETNEFLAGLTQLYAENGTTFQANDLGTPKIYTVEPENLKSVFTTNFNDWGVEPIRLAPMKDFCGSGFLTVDGPRWQHSRALFSPSFDKKAISDFTDLETEFQHMLKDMPKDGETVDVQPLICDLFMDATTLFIFGEPVNALSNTKQVRDACDQAMFGCGMRIALGPFKYFAKTRKWLDACAYAREFAEHYVDKALEHRKAFLAGSSKLDKNARRILLYSLAEQNSSRDELRNDVLQAFFVSQATTGILVSNVFFFLSRDQKLADDLLDEIRRVIGSGHPSFDQLNSMQLLRKILNEAQRVYPVLPQNNRVALRDTRLPTGGGPDGKSPIYARKGTVFDTAYYVLHRSKQIWGDDADQFRVDRWDTHKPGPCEYLPFGAGPRQCIGHQKGLAEAGYVICRFLQTFNKIQSRDDKEWKGHVQLSAKNANGVQVALWRSANIS